MLNSREFTIFPSIPMDSPVKQRLSHIVNSYSLAGEEVEPFTVKLGFLTENYPWFLVELALTEVLVQNWLRYPLPRGIFFLEQVEKRLQEWEKNTEISSYLMPSQFELITGLPPVSFDFLNQSSWHCSELKMLTVESSLGDRPYTTN